MRPDYQHPSRHTQVPIVTYKRPVVPCLLLLLDRQQILRREKLLGGRQPFRVLGFELAEQLLDLHDW